MQSGVEVDRSRADWAHRYLEVLRASGQPSARRSLTLSALCVQKSFVYRQSLGALPAERVAALLACDLPSEVDSLVDVPATSPWVPETHAHAYFLAVAQLCHDSIDDFLHAAYVSSLRLFHANPQRLTLLSASPHMVVKGGPRVWEQMHHGTILTVEPDTSRSAMVRVTHPAHHLDVIVSQMYAVSFEACLHVAGAVDARVSLEGYGVTESVWRARW